MFSPVTDLSNIGVLVENCLEDNEYLISKYLNLPSKQEVKADGSVLGQMTFLRNENGPTKELYKELHEVMIKASSIFLEKNNKTIEDYKISQQFYKLLTWNTPQLGMNAHADEWMQEDKRMVPQITNLLYLTSDFEGGEIDFPDYNIKLKPKSGDVVSFFSNTKHRVATVQGGRRITTQLFLF
jgi:hypothetical protein